MASSSCCGARRALATPAWRRAYGDSTSCGLLEALVAHGMERLRYRKHRGNTVTIDEAREKVRELKVLVELLHSEALCHPENCEAQDVWRASCRDLNLASAALAELLGDRETAAWLRSKART